MAERAAEAGESRTPADATRWPRLPVAGVVVGLWASLPKFVSPDLNVSSSKEIADHVVPAVLVIGVSLIALVLIRQGAFPGLYMFVAGLVISLAGLWMVATHVPLIGQASRGEATWVAALYHSAPAAALALLGIAWVASYWDAVGD